MKTNPVPIILFAFLFTLPHFSIATTVSKDDEEIRTLVETRQQEAWNKHDAKAYASLFTENGDCVNVVGWWWKGRAEIEQKLTAAYAFVFRESVLTITNVDVRLLTPTVANCARPLDNDRCTNTARLREGAAGYRNTYTDKIR